MIVDKNDAPEGYEAVAAILCHGCWFYVTGDDHDCEERQCGKSERTDEQNVIFIKKREDAPVDKNTSPEVGRKDDKDKLRWDLVPWESLEQMVRVMMGGAKKYGEHNWKQVEDGQKRYVNAAIRHLVAYQKGERINEEDFGLPHLAHAITSVSFALWLDLNGEER